MNQSKQKKNETYESPVVADIAPVTVAAVHGEGSNPPQTDDDDTNDETNNF